MNQIQTTYSLTWLLDDSPTDFTVYTDIDEAYDAAEAYSAHAKRPINMYENGVHFAVIKNYK
jgi:hypothetical protein